MPDRTDPVLVGHRPLGLGHLAARNAGRPATAGARWGPSAPSQASCRHLLETRAGSGFAGSSGVALRPADTCGYDVADGWAAAVRLVRAGERHPDRPAGCRPGAPVPAPRWTAGRWTKR